MNTKTRLITFCEMSSQYITQKKSRSNDRDFI
jgi:hypothetical protein